MEDEFLATIKLITGEEIVSKVSYMPDDDSLVLENPMQVTYVDQQKRTARVTGFALTEWIHSTFDHMFVLPKHNIVTMTEVEDERIEKFYDESVKKYINQLTIFKESFETQKFSRKMGNLGSIKETKKSLEDLFNRS